MFEIEHTGQSPAKPRSVTGAFEIESDYSRVGGILYMKS